MVSALKEEWELHVKTYGVELSTRGCLGQLYLVLLGVVGTYANYMMALKPNELTGTWPASYDNAYGNADAGYTGIESIYFIFEEVK